MYERYEMMINRLAHSCLRRMPSNSMSFEDIKSVGNEVYAELMSKRFKPEKGATFGTLLYKSIVNRYVNLIRKEYRKEKKRKALYLEIDEIELIPDESGNQLDELIKKEEIGAVLKRLDVIDKDIADLIRNGPTDELEIFAVKTARVEAWRREFKTMKPSITMKLIETFYNINLSKIIRQVQEKISI